MNSAMNETNKRYREYLEKEKAAQNSLEKMETEGSKDEPEPASLVLITGDGPLSDVMDTLHSLQVIYRKGYQSSKETSLRQLRSTLQRLKHF